MSSFVDSILGWVKLAPKYVLPVALVSGVMVIAPGAWLQALGIGVFVGAYRGWIGVVFLASSALLLSHFVYWVGGLVKGRFDLHDFRRRGRKYLSDLTPGEKRILSWFIVHDTRTQMLLVQDGVTSGLETAGVIYRSASAGDMVRGFAHNIQPWAWEDLRANPSLLEPELSALRDEEKIGRQGY